MKWKCLGPLTIHEGGVFGCYVFFASNPCGSARLSGPCKHGLTQQLCLPCFGEPACLVSLGISSLSPYPYSSRSHLHIFRLIRCIREYPFSPIPTSSFLSGRADQLPQWSPLGDSSCISHVYLELAGCKRRRGMVIARPPFLFLNLYLREAQWLLVSRCCILTFIYIVHSIVHMLRIKYFREFINWWLEKE